MYRVGYCSVTRDSFVSSMMFANVLGLYRSQVLASGVAVGLGVLVGLGEGVDVGVAVVVGVKVGVFVGVLVGMDVAVAVSVGKGVCVAIVVGGITAVSSGAPVHAHKISKTTANNPAKGIFIIFDSSLRHEEINSNRKTKRAL